MARLEALKEKLRNVSQSPGVYLLKNRQGTVIYVGKAKNLRNRLRNYFNVKPTDHPKLVAINRNLADFETIVVLSEREALLLEANLIKKYDPRYNILLKNNDHYPFIKITVSEAFPRIFVTREKPNKKDRYFGPYIESGLLRETLLFIRRFFPLRQCKLALEADAYEHPPRKRPCLNYQLKQCRGVCAGKISQENYLKIVKDLILFLKGKTEPLLDVLQQKMQQASQKLHFEDAAMYRDQMETIKRITEKQAAHNPSQFDKDILGIYQDNHYHCLVQMQVRNGKLLSSRPFITAETDFLPGEMLESFIRQKYLNKENPVYIKELLISESFDEESIAALEDVLHLKVLTPQRGDKKRLIDIAVKNAQNALEEFLIRKAERLQRAAPSVRELKKELHLEKMPLKIGCFDISNLMGTHVVASMVYFFNGKPLKKNYRRFRIKTVDGQNDFASMQEVVMRYLKRAQDEDNLADLLVIDGGKGQLGMAVQAMHDLNIEDLEIISLAKRLEEVFVPGHKDSVIISRSSAALKLLQKVRNEAHRFAIEYHRSLRSKDLNLSRLDDIEGVGTTRKAMLFKQFGSIENIEAASLEALQKVPHLPQNIAQRIYAFFHETDED